MDRLIATNSVDLAGADTAPLTGTPQYATDGTPPTTPPTIFPAYQYNAIQEEILAVIAAASIAFDRTNNAQLLAAIRALGGVPTGTVIESSAVSAPSGYLAATGGAASRSTYVNLFNASTFSLSCTLASSTTITVPSSAAMFPGMPVEGTGIPSGAAVLTIVDGTHITITSAATLTGAETLRFFPYGNGDGSTTFNVINKKGQVGIGAGTSPQGTVRIQGQTLGDENLQGHTHAFNNGANGIGRSGATGVDNSAAGILLTDNPNSATLPSSPIGSTGAGSGGNMPPAVVMNYYVKT